MRFDRPGGPRDNDSDESANATETDAADNTGTPDETGSETRRLPHRETPEGRSQQRPDQSQDESQHGQQGAAADRGRGRDSGDSDSGRSAAGGLRPRDPRDVGADVSADVAAMREEIKARYQAPERHPRRDFSADVAAMGEEVRERFRPPRDVAAEVAAMREEIKARFEARDRDPAAWRRDLARRTPPEPDQPSSARTQPDPPSRPEKASAQTNQKDDQKTGVASSDSPAGEGGSDQSADDSRGQESAEPGQQGKRADRPTDTRSALPGPAAEAADHVDAHRDQRAGSPLAREHSRGRGTDWQAAEEARAAAKAEAEQRRMERYRESLGGEPRELNDGALLDARMLIERRTPDGSDFSKITRGVWYSDEPDWGHVESGRIEHGRQDELAEKAAALLADRGYRRTSLDAHVEVKLAARMVHDDIKLMTVVINRPVCQGPLSCDALLEHVLPVGYRLRVYEGGSNTMKLYEGRYEGERDAKHNGGTQ